MLPKLIFVPLVDVPVPILLVLFAPAVPDNAPLAVEPTYPACEKPSGLAVGPLHDANRLNKWRFKSFDSRVVRLSTVVPFNGPPHAEK